MIGDVIGNYRIVRKLGQGGMGTVYQAVDTMLEREVAIKLLRRELAGETELAERFRTEAIILARLNHPNIATLYGLTREGAQLLMVMEFVRGETLDRIVKRDGRVAPRTAAGWACQVLDAMAYAHRRGVVHRDIKPPNLMVTEEDIIKVMDFGIARVLGSAHQTQLGHVVGTASYMAPEQIRGQEVDGRTDLYALGIVLYQLVTGLRPFRGNDEFAVMTAQINDRPVPPSELADAIPPWLDDAVLRALEKQPSDRFQDATSFRQVLEDGVRSLDEAARAVGEPVPVTGLTTLRTPTPAFPQPAIRKPRTWRAYVALGVPVLLLGAAVVYFLGGGEPSALRPPPGQVVGTPDAGRPGVSPGAGSAASQPAFAPTASAAASGRPLPGASSPATPPVGLAAGDTGAAGTLEGLSASQPPGHLPAPSAAAPNSQAAPVRAEARGDADEEEAPADEPVEPETFDAVWFRGDAAATDVVLTLHPHRLTLSSGDETVLKSLPYPAVSGATYAENMPALRKGSGFGAVGRLFGGGKHYLTLRTGEGEIVLRVGRGYKDVVAAFEKASGKKVTTQ